jgi:hypothetical protein
LFQKHQENSPLTFSPCISYIPILAITWDVFCREGDEGDEGSRVEASVAAEFSTQKNGSKFLRYKNDIKMLEVDIRYKFKKYNDILVT